MMFWFLTYLFDMVVFREIFFLGLINIGMWKAQFIFSLIKHDHISRDENIIARTVMFILNS